MCVRERESACNVCLHFSVCVCVCLCVCDYSWVCGSHPRTLEGRNRECMRVCGRECVSVCVIFCERVCESLRESVRVCVHVCVCVCMCVCVCVITFDTITLSHTLTLTHSLSLSHTHTHTHTHTLAQTLTHAQRPALENSHLHRISKVNYPPWICQLRFEKTQFPGTEASREGFNSNQFGEAVRFRLLRVQMSANGAFR